VDVEGQAHDLLCLLTGQHTFVYIIKSKTKAQSRFWMYKHLFKNPCYSFLWPLLGNSTITDPIL